MLLTVIDQPRFKQAAAGKPTQMKKIFVVFICLLSMLSTFGQENLPTDYLSKEFHAARREAFRNLMPDNSVAVIFSYPERTFSEDINYVFHQNPNLYYLSGYKEPNAVLMLFKTPQQSNGATYKELFFVRQRDAAREIWTGRRLGVEGVKTKLGFSNVFSGKEFKNFGIDFKKFDFILHDVIPDDVKTDNSGFDLLGLLQTFKDQLPPQPSKAAIEVHNELQAIATYATAGNMKNIIAYEKNKAATNDAFKKNALMSEFLSLTDPQALAQLINKIKSQKKWGTDMYTDNTQQLREIKTPEELALLRKSVKISCMAHNEVIRAITTGMSEREAEGIHSFIHKKNGAEEEGYPPIVGSGGNGCILHYEENSALKIDNQLLLMDVGCEYHGYSADVTRTVPANGKFTPEQKAIYQLVYDAQEAIFPLCKEGTPFYELNEKAVEVLAAGMLKLGIIGKLDEIEKYYPHGCSHHLGLDVHDKSAYGNLKENMVITVEPGIYIPAGSPCDKKWWNIGVRIEDDVIIGKEQCENISAGSPRKWDEIEKMAAESSSFTELPALKL